MGKSNRRDKQMNKPLNEGNPFHDPKRAISALQEVYPNIPVPILMRAWAIYETTRKMSESKRNEVWKMINKMPDLPALTDFDDFQKEYKCVECLEEGEYEKKEVEVIEPVNGVIDLSEKKIEEIEEYENIEKDKD